MVDPDVPERLPARPDVADRPARPTDRHAAKVLQLLTERLTNTPRGASCCRTRQSRFRLRLVISVRTVEAHVAAIFLKLGLESGDEVHHPRVLAVLQYLRQ